MNITEFARAHGVNPNAVTNYISRHSDKFEGLIEKQGYTTELSAAAIAILEEKYPLIKPVKVIDGVDPEEHKDALNKIIEMQDAYKEMQKMFADFQEKYYKLENEKHLLEAREEATNLLLEDKKGQLEEMKKSLEEAKNEVNRLKSRGLVDRIFNK